MKRWNLGYCYLFATFFVVGFQASRSLADERIAPGDQDLNIDQAKLFSSYVTAIRNKNLESLRMLYHPKAFACITPENQAFNDMNKALQQEMTSEIPEATETGVSKIDNSLVDKSFDDFHTYSVEPTHIIHARVVEVSGSKFWSSSWGLDIAYDSGQWWLTYPCLTKAGGENMSIWAQHYNKLFARVKSLLETLTDEDKAKIRGFKGSDGYDKGKELFTKLTGETDEFIVQQAVSKIRTEELFRKENTTNESNQPDAANAPSGS